MSGKTIEQIAAEMKEQHTILDERLSRMEELIRESQGLPPSMRLSEDPDRDQAVALYKCRLHFQAVGEHPDWFRNWGLQPFVHLSRVPCVGETICKQFCLDDTDIDVTVKVIRVVHTDLFPYFATGPTCQRIKPAAEVEVQPEYYGVFSRQTGHVERHVWVEEMAQWVLAEQDDDEYIAWEYWPAENRKFRKSCREQGEGKVVGIIESELPTQETTNHDD